MNTREIIAIILDKRNQTAVNVQKLLTAWGCLIKTRLGLHDGVLDNCTQTGLIILEVVGEEEKISELLRKLCLIKGVQAKHIKLELQPS